MATAPHLHTELRCRKFWLNGQEQKAVVAVNKVMSHTRNARLPRSWYQHSGTLSQMRCPPLLRKAPLKRFTPGRLPQWGRGWRWWPVAASALLSALRPGDYSRFFPRRPHQQLCIS